MLTSQLTFTAHSNSSPPPKKVENDRLRLCPENKDSLNLHAYTNTQRAMFYNANILIRMMNTVDVRDTKNVSDVICCVEGRYSANL